MVACACGMSAFTLAPPAAQAQRVSCTYSRGVEKRCGPYACVVDDYRPDFEDEPDPPPGTPGSCGKCRNASDCGGAACKHDGTCAGWPAPTAPEPLRPRIFMLTTDLALDVMDADSPLVSAGFLGQFALSKTRPVALADGGWLTKDLPRWYVSTEAALAFAGPGQNFFFRLGPTYYIHTGPIYITALTAGGVYQRQGASIWDFGDDAENFQRLGPFAARSSTNRAVSPSIIASGIRNVPVSSRL